MAKNPKASEGGTPAKFILKNLEKVHNCYEDLKNEWEDNAFEQDDELTRFICTAFLVFLLGFLFSQISIYLFRDSSVKTEIDTVKPLNCTVTEENIEHFIDYAASNNGGSILTEFSAEEYLGWFTVFSNNRRESLISERNEPGYCWAFNGSYGYISIQLAQKIYPRHFTIFHINSLNYATAPKKLRVYSLDHDNYTALLADFDFDLTIKEEKRKNLAIFECQFDCDEPTTRVLLEVLDNYGASGTCVYQFKVHGIPYI
jgi:hypothetical protein